MATRVLSRPYTVRVPEERVFEAGPWLGVRDDLSPNGASPEWLTELANGYLDNLPSGPSLMGRPGFAQIGDQLASSTNRVVQRIYQFTKRDATQITVAIVKGQFYTYNWSTDTWTEVLDAAAFAGASITVDPAAKIYMTTFADQLIVSDGVSLPWAWDGTVGGGLTKLTNCPVLFGQPVVYYAKLFGIKNTERSTIVWSEEGDPNEGYEALIGGRQYNNAWTVAQTDSRPFYAMAATNRALYLFRARSITEVIGAVADDFQTTGTRESISSVVGCQSPDGVTVVNEDVWFWSAENEPHVIRAGGGLAQVAAGIVEATRASPTTDMALASVVSVYVDYTKSVLFGFPGLGESRPTLFLLVSVANGECVGVWDGFACRTLDVVTDLEGRDRLAHGGGATAAAEDAGYIYLHGRPELDVWNDGLAGGAAPIRHGFTTGYLLYSAALEHRLDRVTVSHITQTDLSGCTLTVVGPAGAGSVQSFSVAGSGGGRWNMDNWDEFTWAGAAGERVADLGRDDEGRWFQVQVRHAALDEQWQVNRVRLVAVRRDARPNVP